MHELPIKFGQFDEHLVSLGLGLWMPRVVRRFDLDHLHYLHMVNFHFLRLLIRTLHHGPVHSGTDPTNINRRVWTRAKLRGKKAWCKSKNILMSLNLHVLCDTNTCILYIYVYVHVLSSNIPSACPTPWESLRAHTMHCANEALLPANGAKGNRLVKEAGRLTSKFSLLIALTCRELYVTSKLSHQKTPQWQYILNAELFFYMSCSLSSLKIDSKARSCQEHEVQLEQRWVELDILSSSSQNLFEPWTTNEQF